MPRHRDLAVAGLLTGVVVTALLPAQTDQGAGPVPAAARPALTLPTGEVGVRALIELVAKYARCNILLDPAVLHDARPYDFEQPIEIREGAALDTLTSLLYVRQFTLLPVATKERVYEVISLVGPRRGELLIAAEDTTVEKVLAAPESKRFVTVTVELATATATRVSNAMRPMLAGMRSSLQIGAPDQHRLVLTGHQHQVASALKIVQRVDQARGDAAADRGPVARLGAADQAGQRRQKRQGDIAFKLLTDRLERLEKRLTRIEKLIEPIVGGAGDESATKAGKMRGK